MEASRCALLPWICSPITPKLTRNGTLWQDRWTRPAANRSYASWEIVRWVISDASAQLFSSTFAAEDIPDLLKMLEKTAAEAHIQVR